MLYLLEFRGGGGGGRCGASFLNPIFGGGGGAFGLVGGPLDET